jgi:hypothetical protein
MTKCPFTNPSCNDHPKTAQNCQRNRKKYKKTAKNARFLPIFTKKLQKITIFLTQMRTKSTQMRQTKKINKMRKLRKYHIRYATQGKKGCAKTRSFKKRLKTLGTQKNESPPRNSQQNQDKQKAS